LLEKQTRPHGDIDVVIQKKDVKKLVNFLKSQGYSEIQRSDSSPHNFIMGNSEAQFVDFHVIKLDEHGNGVYGVKEDGLMYPAEALSGTGMIKCKAVRCISPRWIVKFHTGYELRDKDFHDVLAICKKFAIEMSEEYRKV